MSRGPRKMTEDVIQRWLAEGRGSGTGPSYKPWLEVFDFSSDGIVNRLYSPKLGRVVHLMSTVESNAFYGLEWQESIHGIYEQFPLDRQLTLEIASLRGIRHPYYPGTQVPTVMTVDFLITRVSGSSSTFEAYDCKMTKDAEDEREIEKLAIAQTYFSGMDIPHRLIFDTKIPTQKIKNIVWIRDGIIKSGEDTSYTNLLRDRTNRMASELKTSTRNMQLRDYCHSFEIRHGLRPGDGLRIAKILMNERFLFSDLNNPDLATCPLRAFILNTTSHDDLSITAM